MKQFWHTAYVNTNLLPPGGSEPIKLPARLLTNGSNSVIKNGLKVFITDVKIRSVSTPLADDPSAGVFVAENGNPVSWMLASFNARDGWHAGSPFVVEGDESLQRELLLVCSSLTGALDRFIVQISGYTEVL